MRWSSFLQIQPDSRLVRHNRLFSNWFRVRLKLGQSNGNVFVHRIASKRVVVELRNSRPTKAIRADGRKPGSRAIRLICLVLIAATVIAFCLGATNTAPKTESESIVQQVELRKEQCMPFAPKDSFEIRNLRSFEVDGWHVETFGSEISLGELGSISFEANCRSELVVGSLLHSKIESGHLILRMTPIKRPGS